MERVFDDWTFRYHSHRDIDDHVTLPSWDSAIVHLANIASLSPQRSSCFADHQQLHPGQLVLFVKASKPLTPLPTYSPAY